jgi:ech hydrogenase subunit A
MNWVTFLVLFPLIPAVLLLIFRSYFLQKWIVLLSSALIAIGAIALAFQYMGYGGTYLIIESNVADNFVTVGEIVIALVFLYVCRNLPIKKYWIPLIIILQYVPVIFYDISGKIPETSRYIYIDDLSIIMALIIAIIGTLITIYTVPYMKLYHEEHPEFKDHRHHFIAAVFLFFFAMFGIIFSNTITWIYFFWEITTLCSFIMIGYSRTKEAEHNSFRALWMLLLGGLAFAMAILYATNICHTVELQQLVTLNKAVVMLPILLICFAGMNKAALFPFGSWLLGAMVAPTPSSALLHSSTMVKAGVYIVLRCSPVLIGTPSGAVVAIIGGVSFIMCSAIAIAQSDAKKVLAYSTIAYLGLIVLLAGIGTNFTLWVALLLIVFHAIAKALMFLSVGTVDQQLGSKDIEDMHGLISRMPLVALVMVIGLGGMVLAPFGLIISKIAAIEALTLRSPIFPAIVIFGGSLMLFFYTKWMGTIISVSSENPPIRTRGIGLQWIALGGLSVLMLVSLLAYPWIGRYWIEPLYGWNPMMTEDVELTIIIMLILVLVPLASFLVRWKNLIRTEPYLCGSNVKESKYQYRSSLGSPTTWAFGNYYMKKFFSEEKLFKGTVIGSIILWVLMFFMENL